MSEDGGGGGKKSAPINAADFACLHCLICACAHKDADDGVPWRAIVGKVAEGLVDVFSCAHQGPEYREALFAEWAKIKGAMDDMLAENLVKIETGLQPGAHSEKPLEMTPANDKGNVIPFKRSH